jgi:hypothetical protein
MFQEPNKVDRRQSFQDFKTFRDKFVGRVEFKDTLRRSNDDSSKKGTASERSSLRDLRTTGVQPRGRPHSGGELRDFVGERSGGYLIETDFDFRSPPSTRDSSRDRAFLSSRPFESRLGHESHGGATPRRGQEQIYATPVRRPKDASEPIYAASSVGAQVRRSREQLEDIVGMSDAAQQHSSAFRRMENVSAPQRRKELRVVISEPMSPVAAPQRHTGGGGNEYGDPLSPTTPKDPLR